MIEIVNKFLLGGKKFIPKIHLRKPGFIYRVCVSLTKTKEKHKNLKKQYIQDIFIKMN